VKTTVKPVGRRRPKAIVVGSRIHRLANLLTLVRALRNTPVQQIMELCLLMDESDAE
jgi:hypothetical protein